MNQEHGPVHLYKAASPYRHSKEGARWTKPRLLLYRLYFISLNKKGCKKEEERKEFRGQRLAVRL
jgi:hypothetical protein